VSFCPPDTPIFREARGRGYLSAGQCEGGYEPLLKPVVAIAGDRVSGTDDGISINRRLIASSRSLNRDSLGRALPSPEAHDVIVAKGEVWVISSYNPLSFDSRYFGPVPISRIEGLAQPFFVCHP
jgi:conjugative transfer signal peptidase TraF